MKEEIVSFILGLFIGLVTAVFICFIIGLIIIWFITKE
jgi:hypothetical protein